MYSGYGCQGLLRQWPSSKSGTQLDRPIQALKLTFLFHFLERLVRNHVHLLTGNEPPLAKRLKYEEEAMEISSEDEGEDSPAEEGEEGEEEEEGELTEEDEGQSGSGKDKETTGTTSSSGGEELKSEKKKNKKKKKSRKSTDEKDAKKSRKNSQSGGSKDKDTSGVGVVIKEEEEDTTHRRWWADEPLGSGGIVYVMYTPPPVTRKEVDLADLPKHPVTDIDREPWKTASISWWDPSYGDLSVPTGTYDAIRTLLKDTKRVKRKSLK